MKRITFDLSLILCLVLSSASVSLYGQIPSKLVEHGRSSLQITVEGMETPTQVMRVWISKPINASLFVTGSIFYFDSIEPATYSIVVSGSGYVGASTVNVPIGSRISTRIQLMKERPGNAMIRGRLTESRAGEPVGRVTVRTTDNREVTTDDDGNFFFPNHPIGVVGFAVVKQDTQMRFKSYTINAQGIDTVKLNYDDGFFAVTEGLVAYYPLDYTSIADQGPFENNGVNYGGTEVPDRYGAEGRAIFFNNTRASIPDADWQRTLPMSISFWLRADPETADTTFILGKYLHPSGEGWAIFIENKRLCAGYFRDSFLLWSRVNIDGEIRDGKWRHYAVTIDASRLVLYVNDARIPASAFQTKFEPTKSQHPIHMGMIESIHPGHAPYYKGFVGAIDELAFYNRVLTELEIAELGR